ncbi:MAG: D-alanyl-D-alanine carboxypeptidase family protein [Ruminococcus sp.]|nr:D-alanyl-D-alanine carboxypeptidase family protein [Ruminococcus sp.]
MKAVKIISAVLLIMAGGIFAVKYINNNNLSENNNESSVYNEIQQTEAVTEAVTEEPYIPPVYVECSAEDLHKGTLILVNRENSYVDGSNKDIVNLYSNKNDVYDLSTVDMMLDRSMINAINSMLGDFYAQTGITDVLANSGYRSYDEQKIMYDNDIAATGKQYSTLVAPPGNSEHHTGYAMDFAINDGYSYPALRNEGEYSWIYENANKYGMILRYTEENSHITGYMAESWHFRYVGEPHASLISKMGISFEEYIGFLKDFSFENPLEYRYSDNEFYKIYFVPADIENGSTDVPITYEAFENKDNGFSVSGNNADGFIVTLKTSELSDDYDESFLYMFNPTVNSQTAVPEENVQDIEETEAGYDTDSVIG